MVLFGVLKTSQGTVNFVLGMLSHGARIEKNRIRVFGRLDQLVTSLTQACHDKLAVEHVHLAANGFYVEAFVHEWMERLARPQLRRGQAAEESASAINR